MTAAVWAGFECSVLWVWWLGFACWLGVLFKW